MGLVTATCPGCGGKLQLDDSRSQWFCQYCGSEVIKDKQYIEVSGNVNVAGIATAATLIERGFIELEYKNFSEAVKLFERALDAEPKNWKAYLGRMLGENELTGEKDLYGGRVPLVRFDDFNKAVRFAPEEDRIRLEAINEEVTKAYEQDKAQYDMVMDRINADVEEKRQIMEKAADVSNRYRSLHIGFRKFRVLYIIVTVVGLVYGCVTIATSETAWIWIIAGLIGVGLLISTGVLGSVSRKKYNLFQQATEEFRIRVAARKQYVDENAV